MRIAIACAIGLAMAGCTVETTSQPPAVRPETTAPAQPAVTSGGRPQTMADFRAMVARMEPVAEQSCRELRPNANCDFKVNVDTTVGVPNAYQHYDRSGRPQITFTAGLLKDMRNRDELAFAFGHEAAHHIEAHIEQTVQSARAGAVLGAVLGAAVGLDVNGVDIATNIGGTVGARRFSKAFELEADSLGARIAQRGGYNALRGVQYFARANDPGNQFLGTHPPNAERIAVVQRTLAR